MQYGTKKKKVGKVMRDIKPMTKIKHFKGKIYTFLYKAEHTETGETLAIYQAEYGDKKYMQDPMKCSFQKLIKRNILMRNKNSDLKKLSKYNCLCMVMLQ